MTIRKFKITHMACILSPLDSADPTHLRLHNSEAHEGKSGEIQERGINVNGLKTPTDANDR